MASQHCPKIPPKDQPDKARTKAIVVHGVPCQRSMAQVIQDAGGKEIMGVRWLLEEKRRVGKVTSSVVIFFGKRSSLWELSAG